MENLHSWASGPSSKFAQMSLLNMLAEVATEKLYSDPTVQMISTTKVPEPPVLECANSDTVIKSENIEKSLVNEGKPLTLLQVSKMSDVNLLKYFSLNQANEIKKKFYYTCRLLPSTCEQMTQSFGNEEKARNLMKKHLRSHLRALLQVNNTHSSQENYILRSVMKQKFSSSSEVFGKKKPSKNDSKLKAIFSEKENSVSAVIVPSFTLKPSKSYGSFKEKETKNALKIIRPNSSSSDFRELKNTNLKTGSILNTEPDSLVQKTVDKLSNGVDDISSFESLSSNFVLDSHSQEFRNQLTLAMHSVKEYVVDDLNQSVISHEKSEENSDNCNKTSSPFKEYCGFPLNNKHITNSNGPKGNQMDFSSQIFSNNDYSTVVIEDSTSLQMSIKRSELLKSKQNAKRFKGYHKEESEFESSNKDYVTVSHDHGYVGGAKVAAKQKIVDSESGTKTICRLSSADMYEKVSKKEEDFSSGLISKENTLLSQHMAIELQGEIMAQDFTYCGSMSKSKIANNNEESFSETQITPLPLVGSEVEFKPDINSLKMEACEEELIDDFENDFSYNKTEEEKTYILKKQRKGKGKFIGQSKLEKEMALELINQIKSQSLMVVETLECNICDPPRIFTAPSTLISHYKSHAGICPYVCKICQAVFTRQHSLNYHMLIHSNQTRFTCDDCGRKFRHPSHFKEHRRRHTGESPFSCMDCSMRFKTRNTYKRHLRTRHGKVLTTQGQVQYICDNDGSNSEGTIEIKAEDDSAISCVTSFEKHEKEPSELSFINEDTKIVSLNAFDKIDYDGQSCVTNSTNNLDYSNLLHHLTPDISIIAVDKQVSIPNTFASSSSNTAIVDKNNKFEAGNKFSEPSYNMSLSQESELLYDISILPAEPMKATSDTLFGKYDNQNEDDDEKHGTQIVRNDSQSMMDVLGENSTCSILNCVSDVNISVNKFHPPNFDFNSIYHKDISCSSGLNNVNTATLVNKIESVVNMELNGMALPLHSRYSSQNFEIREAKYLIGQRTSGQQCSSITNSDDKSLCVVDVISQNTQEDSARAPGDKWTNLMKEVLSLSSAVNNKGKQEFSSDLCNSKPVFDSNNEKVNTMSYSDQSSCSYIEQSRVRKPNGGDTVINDNTDTLLIKPVNQYTQTSLTNVDEKIDAKYNCNMYKEKPSIDDEQLITYSPVLKSEINPAPSNLFGQAKSKRERHLIGEEQYQQINSLYREKSQSKCNLNSEASVNHIQMSNDLYISTMNQKAKVENTRVVTPLVEGKVKEMYLIKCIKKPGGHFAKVFKADSNIYMNDSGKTISNVNIFSANQEIVSEYQPFKPITESSSKLKPVIVTTSKPIRCTSEFNKTLVTTKRAMKTNSAPISVSSNNGTVLVQTKQCGLSAKNSNVMLLGAGLPHSATEPSNGTKNLITVTKNSVSNVESFIKIPIMSSAMNSSIVQSLLIPASTTSATIISSSFVPMSATSNNTSSSGIHTSDAAVSKTLELSSSPWNPTLMTTGTKTTSLIRTTPSVSSNTITLYPSNAVFINSSSATNVDSEALTLNFSNQDTQPSNILILNSGNGGPPMINSDSKPMLWDVGKAIDANQKVSFGVTSTSHGYSKVKSNSELPKYNVITSTSSFMIPSDANNISSVPLSTTCTLPLYSSVATQKSMYAQSTSHTQRNNSKSNSNNIKILESPPTGILSHLLSSGKSISSGSFYYSNYDGLLKNDRNSVQ